MTLLIKNGGYVFLIRLYLMLSMSLGKEFQSRKHSSGWRRLEDVFKAFSRRLAKTFSRHLQNVFKTSCKNVFKTFSRRLQDRDEYIYLTHTSSEDVFKTSWSRPIYFPWSYVFKTFSRRLQDVFKISSRHLALTFSRRLQNVFKTSSCKNVFKTSCKDVFKTCSRRIIELICSC